MKIFENRKYQEEIAYVADMNLPWEKLQGSSVMISGATGMIGSFLIDVLLHKNQKDNLNCKIFALGRNEEKARERFSYCFGQACFSFLSCDINKPLNLEEVGTIDYVLHLASNTHPLAYATDPIGTITTNIIGTNNLLEFATTHGTKRFVFASSNEIYGENRGDVELFEETYCGYIDSNSMRAGYPESKRAGEALCQAYISSKKLDVVIPRFTRTYGPTLLDSDTKALSQFLAKAINGENIILKSEGMQYFSYLHVMDSVSGLLTVLLNGENGQAYNIADEKSDIRLKDLAAYIAESVGKQVVFEIPDETERAGYSKATKARLDSTKLQKLGWRARYDIQTGLESTIEILKDIRGVKA